MPPRACSLALISFGRGLLSNYGVERSPRCPCGQLGFPRASGGFLAPRLIDCWEMLLLALSRATSAKFQASEQMGTTDVSRVSPHLGF